MRKTIFILFFGLLYILTSCKQIQENNIPAPKYTIQIERDSILQEVTWLIKDSLEQISLETYLTDLNKGVLRYRYAGNTPLKNQIPKLDALLYTIFEDTTIENNFSTLAWGRLSDDRNKDYTLAKRLSLMAFNSDLWDKKKGKHVNDHENNYVSKNAGHIAPELDTLFMKYNLKIESVSVEKVLISSAENLPYWHEIKDSVKEEDKLPWDCQTWFLLEQIN